LRCLFVFRQPIIAGVSHELTKAVATIPNNVATIKVLSTYIIGLPITVLFLPDITKTEKSCVLITYKLPLAGSKAIPHGLPSAAQHGIFLITVLFLPDITDTAGGKLSISEMSEAYIRAG
jgi:hypothetical protein